MPTKATKESKKSGSTSVASDLWLATLGAFSLAEEEVGKFVKRLVDRGSLSQAEGKKLISDLQSKVKKNRLDFGKVIEDSVAKTLSKLNIPSKREVHELMKKVDALTQKIDSFGSKAA